jgi:hypothetical protein
MKKLNIFVEGESNKAYNFTVKVLNPKDEKEFFMFTMFSYVRESATLAAICKENTKYPIVISEGIAEGFIPAAFIGLSINQLIGYLRRVSFYEVKKIHKTKVIKWTEEIVEEL